MGGSLLFVSHNASSQMVIVPHQFLPLAQKVPAPGVGSLRSLISRWAGVSAGLLTVPKEFRCGNAFLRRTVFSVIREGVLWGCRNSRRTEDFRFQAKRHFVRQIRGPWRLAAKMARIFAEAVCYSRAAAEGYAFVGLTHAFRFSSSAASSKNHGTPCRICLAMSSHT